MTLMWASGLDWNKLEREGAEQIYLEIEEMNVIWRKKENETE